MEPRLRLLKAFLGVSISSEFFLIDSHASKSDSIAVDPCRSWDVRGRFFADHVEEADIIHTGFLKGAGDVTSIHFLYGFHFLWVLMGSELRQLRHLRRPLNAI